MRQMHRIDLTEISDAQMAVIEEVTTLGEADDNWAKVGVNKYEGSLLAIYSDSGVLTAFAPEDLLAGWLKDGLVEEAV